MVAGETAERIRKRDCKIMSPLAPSAFALVSFSASRLFEGARRVFPHSTPSTSPGHTLSWVTTLTAGETAKSRALGRKTAPDPVSTASRNGHKVAALVVAAGVVERNLAKGQLYLSCEIPGRRWEKGTLWKNSLLGQLVMGRARLLLGEQGHSGVAQGGVADGSHCLAPTPLLKE